jgi:hypothetical protein
VNEEADKRAKAAAELGKAAQGSGKQCKLASAAKRAIRQKAVDEWADAWKKTKVAAPTRRLLKAPTRKSRKLYLGLRKAHSSVLIQLRTGRIGLNQYLHKIGIAESEDCTCGEEVQSPRHILLECRVLVSLRNEMWKKIEMKVKRARLDFDALVSEPLISSYIADFMIQTGLLGQFQAVEASPEEGGLPTSTASRDDS